MAHRPQFRYEFESQDIIGVLLGTGGYGAVVHTENAGEIDNLVIFKRPHRDEDGNIDLESAVRLWREAEFLEALTTKKGTDTRRYIGGIVPFWEYVGPQKESDFVDKSGAVRGNALSMGRGVQLGNMDAQDIASVCMDISYTLARLHKWGIIHGDVKPANMVMFYSSARLCDFGMAGVYDAEKLPKHLRHLAQFPVEPGGTLAYMAPEILPSLEFLAEGSSSRKSWLDGFLSSSSHMPSPSIAECPKSWPGIDVYAFGCTVWELVTGNHPFPQRKPALLAAAKRDGALERPPYTASSLQSGLLDVAQYCMTPNPEQRPVMAHMHEMIGNIAHGKVQTDCYPKEWM